MTVRQLTGATGNLYDPDSEACHVALAQLSDVLDHLGFTVPKKPAVEATLRVYPVKYGRYPLLNPRFEPTAVDVDPTLDTECLDFTVWSRGDDGSLDRHLRAFPGTHDCAFVPVGTSSRGYYCHGHFIIPVHFTGPAGSAEIDFMSLGIPLRSMLTHLRGVP